MSEYVSIDSLSTQAQSLVARGRLEEAEVAYRRLLLQTHVTDYEYDDWSRSLAQIYTRLGRNREAAIVHMYLHDFGRARAEAEQDLKILAQLDVVQERFYEAALKYKESAMPVHAAVFFDKAKRFDEAAAAWRAVCSHPAIRNCDYERALSHFNYGMSLREADSGSDAYRAALIESQRILEQVGATFESKGQRDRAFDCYQVLLELGKRSGQFENLAEGYLGCIRVLKDDNLKFYALQYYEDFIELSLSRREYHAAATSLQEASQYCGQVDLPYGNYYQSQAGDAWAKCAQRHGEESAPISLVENSLLAAVGCYSSVGDFSSVRELFSQLSSLELDESSRARYAKVAKRYVATTLSTSFPKFPEYLRKQHAYADIWHSDMLSWELGADADGVAASVVGDLRFHNSIRRRALAIMLLVAQARRDETYGSEGFEIQVIQLLGELQSYGALIPLEQKYTGGSPHIKKACVDALRFLYFKRSFVILRLALDEGGEIRESAVKVLRGRYFDHALNPLRQLFENEAGQDVKVAALEAVGKIQSVEAGEYLIELVRQERGDIQRVALTALRQRDNPDIVPILKQHAEVERDEDTRNALLSIARAYR